MSPQTKTEEEDVVEAPFVPAVTLKDKHGHIDLGAIAESEQPLVFFPLIQFEPVFCEETSFRVPAPPRFLVVRWSLNR